MPRTPNSASGFILSQGKVPSIQRRARSRNSLCANSRTVETKRRCSSVRVGNTGGPPGLQAQEYGVAATRLPLSVEETPDQAAQGFVRAREAERCHRVVPLGCESLRPVDQGPAAETADPGRQIARGEQRQGQHPEKGQHQ